MAETDTVHDQYSLRIVLDRDEVQVSYLSSLLRVLQATLREVGHEDERTRHRFEERPSPVLMVTVSSGESPLGVGMFFSNSSDASPVKDLSRQVFNAFVDRFAEYVSSLPQPSLFGGAAPGSSKRSLDTPLSQRMDQVHRELRRAGKVTIQVGKRTVRIEGESMGIT